MSVSEPVRPYQGKVAVGRDVVDKALAIRMGH